MNIIVRGRRRFELLLLDREKPYLRGAAQFFEDELGEVPLEDTRRMQVLELYARVLEILDPEDPSLLDRPPDIADDQLSFQVIARLPADLAFKQKLLENRSEDERLSHAINYLRELAVHLKWVGKARSTAGGNGHCR